MALSITSAATALILAQKIHAVGGATDYNVSSMWTVDRVETAGCKGYGLFAAAGDGDVGEFKNGRCLANQLGCFADVGQYNNLYTNINGINNGLDPNAPTTTKPVTSCTITEGVATCVIPSHGFITNDWVKISGASLSTLNSTFYYITVLDSNDISFQCGAAQCGSSGSSTGGTAGALPGAHIWAQNNLYAGAFAVGGSPNAGQAQLDHIYME
jgi:hypothetical protein